MSRLDLHLLARRSGWLLWLATLLVAGAAALTVLGTARLDQALESRNNELQQLLKIAATPIKTEGAPELPLIDTRFEQFRSVLGDKAEMHRLVALMFTTADKHAITLAQAQYKLDFDKAGAFYTYQVTLPVRGTYPRLRHFVDATLQAAPSAALEDVDFKRDGIGAAATEARLRFVFYLKDAGS
jgi:hypothetical protein